MRGIHIFTAVVLVSSANPGAAAPAITGALSTSGKVWTNSSILPSGATVHAGDRIATDDNGMAIVSLPRMGRVEVRNDTEITLTDDHIILHKGVVATDFMAVCVGEHRVQAKQPMEGRPHVVVALRDGKQLVAAHRGSALITNAGTAPVLVPSGSFAMAVPRAQQDNSGRTEENDEEDKAKEKVGAQKEENRKAKKGVAVGGAAGAAGAGAKAAATSWTIGSLSHAASISLVAGVGAAAVSGTVAGAALTGDSSSPSQ